MFLYQRERQSGVLIKELTCHTFPGNDNFHFLLLYQKEGHVGGKVAFLYETLLFLYQMEGQSGVPIKEVIYKTFPGNDNFRFLLSYQTEGHGVGQANGAPIREVSLFQ